MNEEEKSNSSDDDDFSKTGKNVDISDNEKTLSRHKKPKSIEIIGDKIGDNESFYLSFKLIIIGDSGVGKTSIINRAINDVFETVTKTQIGFESCDLYIKINKKIIKFQIWDTCGQEIYQSLVTNFYRNSSAALLVYSIDNKKSFENINFWLEEIQKINNPDAKIFLIGNKTDLYEKREITYDEANNFSEKFEFSNFFESSAKSGDNVKNIFIGIADLLIQNYSSCFSISLIKNDKSNTESFSLSKEEAKKNKKNSPKLKAGCC